MASSGSTAKSDPAAGSSPATGGGAGASAQVALSGTSLRLVALQNGDQDIDLAQVASIRAAIASGQLKIDTSRIADALIASTRELLK